MNSRDIILEAVKRNQPAPIGLPDIKTISAIQYEDLVLQFGNTLQNIGGTFVAVNSLQHISAYVKEHFKSNHLLVTTINGIDGLQSFTPPKVPAELETVELAVLQASFGVAENGAVWIPEGDMGERVLPFICQHLAVVLKSGNIVHNMHEAYARIGSGNYGFGSFIAGPSKTADIEQSLVLGAHGPSNMTVFLLKDDA